jgi:hypothetical protein
VIQPRASVPPVLQGRNRPFGQDDLPRLKRIVQLLPVLKRERVGRFVHLDVEYVVQTENFHGRDLAILKLFDRGRLATYTLFWRTGYFRNQRGRGRSLMVAFRRVKRYRRLFRSIREEGLWADPERVETLAWIFCAENVYFRMDGHHRTAVARYLGYQRVPVMAVTPRDLLALARNSPDPEVVLDADLIRYLEGLEAPTCLADPPSCPDTAV